MIESTGTRNGATMSAPDVCVIGAGLVGTGIAYELAKRGATVTVFDRAEPMRAASWAGAGMLAPYSEDIADAALLALCDASLRAYPAFVAELRERTGVDAKFRTSGTLHVALDDAAAVDCTRRADTLTARGGQTRVLDRRETLAREPMLAGDVRGGVLVENEAHVDNRRLARALTASAVGLGVRFVNAGEIALEADARRARGVRTERGFHAAGIVVNAAGAWSGELGGVPAHARIAVRPVAGEMIALAVPDHYCRGLVWSPDCYLVPRDDGRLLIGATVIERGFDVRVTARGASALLAAALRTAPSLGTFAVVEMWAGLRPASRDGRPYIGTTAIDGYLVASGHYRNGILLAPVTAQAVAQLVTGVAPDIDMTAFAPGRAIPEAA